MSSLQIPCPQCGAGLRLRDPKLLGKTGKCPKCGHKFVLQEPDEVQLELAEAPAAAPAQQQPLVGTAAQWVPDSAPATAAAPNPAAAVATFAPDPATDRVRQFRKKRRRSRKQMMMNLVVLLVIVAAGGGGFYALSRMESPGAPAAATTAAKPKLAATTTPAQPVEPDWTDLVAEQTAGKKGEPIELRNVPAGARIIFNLRPAELWKAGRLGEGEFMACLGPVGTWMKSALQSLCLEDPANIEEAMVCIIPGMRGTPPDVSVVVHLVNEAKKSDLLEKFAAERMDDLNRVYYANDDRAFMILDLKTYAISPRKLAAEMVQGADYAPTDIGIEELLPHTDRSKMFTAVFVPQDVRLNSEFLAPTAAQSFLQHAIDWLSSDGEVEAVAWSLHPGEPFESQLLLRNKGLVRPHTLQKTMQANLEKLPRRILETVEKMNPQQKGQRRLIGRVPAMSKMFAMKTKFGVGERYVALNTVLPERAGPNLALGTLLAWDESTRTDFSPSAAPTPQPSTSKVPELIADRLKTVIDVDFRREPLERAFLYIAGEAKFDLTVDGEALKLGGFTKNMEQNFQLGKVTAAAAMQAILEQKGYEQMAIVVDEQRKLVTVTTRKAAEDQGLKVWEFK